MTRSIGLITIFTAHLAQMVEFYRDVLGFEVESDMGGYVEFKSSGVRFAICDIEVMIQAVDHPSLKQPRSGQTFELAFPVSEPREVDDLYSRLITGGAGEVQAPMDMPWNQRTAFFADPDGNIHEIFADLTQVS